MISNVKKIEIKNLIYNGDANKLRHELESGVKLNDLKSPFEDFLIESSLLGNCDILRILIEYNENINYCCPIRHESAACIASQHDRLDVLKILHESGADFGLIKDVKSTPLMFSIKSNSSNCALWMIKNKITINVCDRFGVSPLHVAAYMGNLDLGLKLIAKRAKINRVAKGSLNHQTPLIDSIHCKNYDFTEMLIKKGANVNLGSYDGLHFPITKAAETYNGRILQLLIDSGVDLDAVTGAIESAIAICENNYDIENAKLLKNSIIKKSSYLRVV